MKRGILKILFAVIVLSVPGPVLRIAGEEYILPEHDYYVDIPQGWEVLQAGNHNAVSFTDPGHAVVFEIQTHPREKFKDIKDYFSIVKSNLSARGEGAEFRYHGYSALLADLELTAAGYPARGYFIFLLNHDKAVCFYAMAPKDSYQGYHDLLLSVLNSFSPSEETTLLPGPVSFFYYTSTDSEKELVNAKVPLFENNFRTLQFSADRREIEASMVVLEREARILSAYPPGHVDAWRRFFRVLYRDNYKRLEPVYLALRKELNRKTGEGGKINPPEDILYWLQRFEYHRPGTVSDITPPLEALLEGKGDCDSLGLIYTILLHHFNYSSILLVSPAYGHAVAAVDMPGAGARYTYDGTSYLIAELTEKVNIGLIAADMADSAKWIAIPF